MYHHTYTTGGGGGLIKKMGVKKKHDPPLWYMYDDTVCSIRVYVGKNDISFDMCTCSFNQQQQQQIMKIN